jgi:hypothetical protein
MSIVNAKVGLEAMSAIIVSPAGTDRYNEFVNDAPMENNNGIAMDDPTDHRPNIVLGIIIKDFSAIEMSRSSSQTQFHLVTGYPNAALIPPPFKVDPLFRAHFGFQTCFLPTNNT